MDITNSCSVGEIAATFPNTISVFEQHQIDYCCKGGQTITEAMVKQNISVDILINQLNQAAKKQQPVDNLNWTKSSLRELIYHILGTHHLYLIKELPYLRQTLSKTMVSHDKDYPELLGSLKQVFDVLEVELMSHMMKEERILFPLVQDMEIAKSENKPSPEFSCGSVDNPIRVMQYEHDNAGNALAKIRHITDNYSLPANTCNTFRALFCHLYELEKNLHQHIHLENNILFPRAIALERSLLCQS